MCGIIPNAYMPMMLCLIIIFFNKMNDLIGIPLQTRMIAEIYQDDLENDNIEFKNLADFYDKFISAKYLPKRSVRVFFII